MEDKVADRYSLGTIALRDSDERKRRRVYLAPPLAAARADSILSTHT